MISGGNRSTFASMLRLSPQWVHMEEFRLNYALAAIGFVCILLKNSGACTHDAIEDDICGTAGDGSIYMKSALAALPNARAVSALPRKTWLATGVRVPLAMLRKSLQENRKK